MHGVERGHHGRGEECGGGQWWRWGRRPGQVDAFQNGLAHLLHSRNQLLLQDKVSKTIKKLKYSQILNGCTCTYAFITWPSHISSKEALSLVALASLLWNNFPSKKPQGQQWSHGKGCPHTSFTKRAVSTPLMNREANCTPRLSTFSTWYQCQREEYDQAICLALAW